MRINGANEIAHEGRRRRMQQSRSRSEIIRQNDPATRSAGQAEGESEKKKTEVNGCWEDWGRREKVEHVTMPLLQVKQTGKGLNRQPVASRHAPASLSLPHLYDIVQDDV